MGAAFRTCRGRGVISRGFLVVLATGTTISLTALTGGIAPALGDPGRGDSGNGGASISTPVAVPVPRAPGGGNPRGQSGDSDAAAAPQQPRFAPQAPQAPPAPPAVQPAPQEVPVAPQQPPAVKLPPKQQAPVEPQAPAQPAPAPEVAPEPTVTVGTPPKTPKPPEAPPAVADLEPVTATIPSAAPKSAPKPVPRNSFAPPPPSAAPAPVEAPAPAVAPSAPASPPTGVAAPSPKPEIAPGPSAPPSAPAGPPSAPAGPPSAIAQPGPNVAAEPSSPKSPPSPEAIGSGPTLAGKGASGDSTAATSAAATPSKQNDRVLQVHDGAKLQAPQEDIDRAKAAKPVEQEPEPAKKDDVDELKNAITMSRATADDRPDFNRPGQPEWHHPGKPEWDNPGKPEWDNPGKPDWDKHNGGHNDWHEPPRQWDRNWVQYDDYYRPVLFNPYQQTVKIIYVYQNQPRIVYINPLQRIVLNVIEYAAYSFTALVVDTIGTVVNAAVGTFFGGGYYPNQYYAAPPPPPPPLQTYNQVPVSVNYSNASYQPFLVNRVVDVGDDAVYGERKVLLDGATPAWGQWTQTPDGTRQFEVHKTQQFPGLDEPREGPLPGDYQLRLANNTSDESSSRYTAKDVWAIAGSGVVGALGLSWLVTFLMSRRRSRELY